MIDVSVVFIVVHRCFCVFVLLFLAGFRGKLASSHTGGFRMASRIAHWDCFGGWHF